VPISMPGLPGIKKLLICLGELNANAPKSCWSVLGTRQRSACREEFGSLFFIFYFSCEILHAYNSHHHFLFFFFNL